MERQLVLREPEVLFGKAHRYARYLDLVLKNNEFVFFFHGTEFVTTQVDFC